MLSTKTTTRASNPGPWPSSCKTHNLMQRTEHLVLWLEVALAIPYLASQLLTLPLPHFSLQVPTTQTLKACQFSRSSSWMSPSPTANFLQTLGSQTSHPLARVVPSHQLRSVPYPQMLLPFRTQSPFPVFFLQKLRTPRALNPNLLVPSPTLSFTSTLLQTRNSLKPVMPRGRPE